MFDQSELNYFWGLSFWEFGNSIMPNTGIDFLGFMEFLAD
jgi:hypothetical protein